MFQETLSKGTVLCGCVDNKLTYGDLGTGDKLTRHNWYTLDTLEQTLVKFETTTKILLGNALENGICEMVSILFRP